MFHVYEIPPIDYNQVFLQTIEEVVEKLKRTQALRPDDDQFAAGEMTHLAFLGMWHEAQLMASKAGFDGRYREEPRVFWIPSDGQMKIGFFLKQDNNGTTYIVSEEPMVHLEAIASNL